LDGWQIVGCLGLIDTKGIPQQVHTSFHVVVYGITDLLALAASIFLGTLTVDILSFGFNNDQT
jgi:hypothetical protein